VALLRKLGGSWLTQMVVTAAKIGLPEALARGPLPLGALAEALPCHEGALARLLPALVGEGLLVVDAEGRYALTEVGEQLRADALGPLALFIGSGPQWAAWGAFEHTVRTGEPAFRRVHGRDFYEYLDGLPEAAGVYDAAMDAFTRDDARGLAEGYDFSATREVVDVGGGWGNVLFEVLGRYPGVRGTLLDTGPVVARAARRFEAAGLSERFRGVGGDFTEQVPAGADCYVIKHVLHNWGDADCVRLLERCAAAMAPGGRVLVVDYILLPGHIMDMTRLLDLEMMVLTERGRERTKGEFRRLLRGAGLRLKTTLPLSGSSSRVLVAERR
jgi:predicted O-methyltransferase YrrM